MTVRSTQRTVVICLALAVVASPLAADRSRPDSPGILPLSVGRTGSHSEVLRIVPVAGQTGSSKAINVTMTVPASLPVAPSMTTANRTSGVAPLSVLFDAVNTSSPAWASGVVQPGGGDYGTSSYEWDFGDSNAGNWSAGRRKVDGTYTSRNRATGYFAAHLYQNPGTYTATLKVTDAGGQVQQYSQQIVVQAAPAGGWRTYYVSSSGNDANNGTSPSRPLQTFSKAIGMLRPNCQVLFKRGDSWSLTGTRIISVTGPAMIGAYGSGNAPRLVATTGVPDGAPLLEIGSGSRDLRLCDLAIVGNWNGVASTGSCDGLWNHGTQILCSNLSITNTGASGILTDGKQLLYQDCQIHTYRRLGMYSDPTQLLAVLGCTVTGPGTTHNIYTHDVWKGAFQANTLLSAPAHNLIVAAGVTTLTWPARYVCISDNYMRADWNCVDISGHDDRYADMQQVVIERNDLKATKPFSCASGAGFIMVRNNVLDGTTTIESGTPAAGMLDPHDIALLNNTMLGDRDGAVCKLSLASPRSIRIQNNILHHYSTQGGWADPCGISFSSASILEQVQLSNNLYYLPAYNRVANVAGTNYTLSQWQAQGRDPGSLSGDPLYVNFGGGNCRLQAGSPGRNRGTNVAPCVREDCDQITRPAGGSYDIGAFEYPG